MSDLPRLRVACLQLNASEDMAANIDTLRGLAIMAHNRGARLITMPENAVMMTWGRDSLLSNAYDEADHPALIAFEDLARELSCWLLIGSLHVKLDGEDRIANRSFLIGPDGKVSAKYDKIHMFDVELDNGETYRESAVFRPGDSAVVARAGEVSLGLGICYDLRFAHLFREYGKQGVDIITVPAAFTKTTGEAHWHSLLRARAIETGAYILAPAQTGIHANNRATFGHSLIIDPWGRILADAGDSEPGMILADIDRQQVVQARKQIPCLTHDRAFDIRST